MEAEERNEYSDLIQDSILEQSRLDNETFGDIQDASSEDLKM